MLITFKPKDHLEIEKYTTPRRWYNQYQPSLDYGVHDVSLTIELPIICIFLRYTVLFYKHLDHKIYVKEKRKKKIAHHLEELKYQNCFFVFKKYYRQGKQW